MIEDKFSRNISQHVSDGNWREIESCFNKTDFAVHLGINVVLDKPAQPKCEINSIMPFHLGGVGQDYINGAVISGLFDLVIGLTALGYSSLGNFATSSVNIRMLKPVDKNRLYAVAKIRTKIGNIVFSEATLFNFKDEPCGYASGEIRVGIN